MELLAIWPTFPASGLSSGTAIAIGRPRKRSHAICVPQPNPQERSDLVRPALVVFHRSGRAGTPQLHAKESSMASRWQSFSPVWNQLQNAPVWGQLQQLQNEMNRVFERVSNDGGPTFAASYPAVNVWEDADGLYVEAELPGVDQKD